LRVGTLSGGQKAQLALTIALARRPAPLVPDEPFAAPERVATYLVVLGRGEVRVAARSPS